MSIQQVTLNNEPLKYKRLLAVDIVRIPNNNKHMPDIYYGKTKAEIKRLKKKSLLQKIFTVATFGIAGLYMAHKNDCFKPIKKEVKNLLKDTGIQNKVKQFIEGANPLEHYSDFVKKYLTKLSTSNKASDAVKSEASKILQTEDLLTVLINKITNKAKGEVVNSGKVITKQEYSDGIFYSLMEKLKIRLEKDLTANKKNGIPYKNKGREVFDNLFKQNGTDKPIDELLYDVIKGRISESIDKHIDKTIFNAE